MTGRTIASLAAAAGVVLLTACGGGGGGSGPTTAMTPTPTPTPTPEPEPPRTDEPSAAQRQLATPRFTTHQPRVLEQIGAHHAYARGLTGRGVRIGIDDTIVDYTQTAEFGDRVKLRDADGAVLSYPRPLGDLEDDVQQCEFMAGCDVWTGDSGGDPAAENRWVQQIVAQDGWPTRDDGTFILDEYYPADGSVAQLLRWSEVPTPYGAPNEGAHGTVVASVAAGTNLGVAPEATIIPLAKNFDDQATDALASTALQLAIQALPAADRRQVDAIFARELREDLQKFDIINRSWGLRTDDVTVPQTIEDIQWFNAYLPDTLRAIWQIDTPDAEKTINVWAAGNTSGAVPDLGGFVPYGVAQIRGHTLAVAATDPRTGIIATYSNRCGPLPADWNATRWGPHYCIAAPGTVRGLVPNPRRHARGDATPNLGGTSFAAPVVSGALALMFEHFRGTRGNTEIVRRMLDTADRSGVYANAAIYGAGHLDLEAALAPVGALTAGRSDAPLTRTAYSAPAAYGAVAARVGGLELAAFDRQDFPFWVPVSGLVSSGATDRSPIPQFDATAPQEPPAAGLASLGLQWASLPDLPGDGWTLGVGETSASLARAPDGDGWGYGFSFRDRGHMEGKTSGAFGSDLRSGMLWTSRTMEHELGGRWTVSATGTVALDLPRYERRAIFRPGPAMMSAAAVRIGTEGLGVTVEQPLRAETGTGTFRLENGRIENGRRLHDTHRVKLRPDGRELRMTLRHERPAMGGLVAFEAGGAVNGGHVPGEREASVGVAWRWAW